MTTMKYSMAKHFTGKTLNNETTMKKNGHENSIERVIELSQEQLNLSCIK
ncbi:hypothetical protein Glove_194g176 [Diversispora epigaea]|uniref:Uncharacterized protein n=1 Tax=Diversispora epigaea TaxID=1348612 RepID=A0A397IKY0_9GLOM|nr:hypothetical protein Glove_194g176 [Diversispora epigaea]